MAKVTYNFNHKDMVYGYAIDTVVASAVAQGADAKVYPADDSNFYVPIGLEVDGVEHAISTDGTDGGGYYFMIPGGPVPEEGAVIRTQWYGEISGEPIAARYTRVSGNWVELPYFSTVPHDIVYRYGDVDGGDDHHTAYEGDEKYQSL